MKPQSRCLILIAVSSVLIGASIWAAPWAPASDLPQGLVLTPRLQGFYVKPAQDASFVFEGWVDFPGSEGVVEIDVFNFGNGDSNDAASWEIAVAKAVSSNTATMVNGQARYRWKVGPMQIFQPSIEGQDRWPEGGTARVRFRAIRNDHDGSTSQSLLPVRDRDGVKGHVEVLILGDKNPTPANPPPGGKSPDFLNRKPRASRVETEDYYKDVGTNPTGDGPSIFEALRTFKAFRARYFDVRPECNLQIGTELVAKYFNRGDLGIGREMHCLWNTCTQERACYVHNYGRRDGTPRFGDMAESFEALKAQKPFATVAMVERDQMRGAPNNVFFVVYDNDPVNPRLAFEAPLDNQQFNKFIPGNCLVCHGSGSRYVFKRCEGIPALCTKNQVHDAFLLPFDLSAFRFYSSDPENPLSRALQDINVFWHLNRMVFLSRLGNNLSGAAAEVMSGWHGVPFNQGFFNDDFIPGGWKQTRNAQQLYRRVVAPTCRSCHISHPTLTFGTFEQFNSLRSLIYEDLCRSHAMPNAEQSTKVFWRSDARPQFLNRMNIQFGCGLSPTATASASARTATEMASTEPNRSALNVFQDYQEQSCACVTKECLDAVEENFIGEFSTMTYDDPSAGEAIETLRSEAVECHLKVLELKD